MRSIIRIPLLCCCAVLAAVTFVECSVTSVPDRQNLSQGPYVAPILVGEETPVWIADRPDPNKPVIYTRLSTSIIKEALLYWQTKKSSDGFPIRQSRSSLKNNIEPPPPAQRPNEESNAIPVLVNLAVNEGTEPTDLYPTVLVVVDYDHFLPMTKENEETVIKERILYALAFWNSVAFDLEHIKRPHVHIRIGGIVITRNRKASPYINTTEYYSSLVSSLTPMLDYWSHDANNAQGVPLGSYDIVAHMTDSNPYREAGYKIYAGIASTSNPCAITNGISGVIVYDDLAFLGIHTAVEKMTNVFGDNSNRWDEYTYDRKQWTPTTLDKIHNGLKNADCMSAPKEYFPPGKPITPPLAGDLLPRAKQCEAHGFNKRTFHCWTTDFWGLVTSTCVNLKCSNSFTSITCSYSNPTLDGTFCSLDNKKICMAGQCVLYE